MVNTSSVHSIELRKKFKLDKTELELTLIDKLAEKKTKVRTPIQL